MLLIRFSIGYGDKDLVNFIVCHSLNKLGYITCVSQRGLSQSFTTISSGFIPFAIVDFCALSTYPLDGKPQYTITPMQFNCVLSQTIRVYAQCTCLLIQLLDLGALYATIVFYNCF